MKGVIFTEFLDFIEAQHGILVADQVITTAELPADRAYTSSGTYPFSELLKLVNRTHEITRIAVPDLLANFGCHMFGTLIGRFPSLADGCADAYTLMLAVDSKIHVEVSKLFPDAELPHIKVKAIDGDTIRFEYRSPRCLADFAEGMLQGCFRHFGENFQIMRRELSEQNGAHSEFIITRLRGDAA